ncbi:hypothetical protein K1719_012648 [Acacia pycnantha]|nr:hypothetical protein K1719_012648 [Acacia pycnantha]
MFGFALLSYQKCMIGKLDENLKKRWKRERTNVATDLYSKLNQFTDNNHPTPNEENCDVPEDDDITVNNLVAQYKSSYIDEGDAVYECEFCDALEPFPCSFG